MQIPLFSFFLSLDLAKIDAEMCILLLMTGVGCKIMGLVAFLTNVCVINA